MIKRIIVIVVVLVTTGALYYLITRSMHIDENLIISKLRPPEKDILTELPQGSDSDFPLIIPDGFRLAVFAETPDAPRVLALDINDVLHASLPSTGKIVALPDKDGDGIAETIITVLDKLDRPHGIAFTEDSIIVAETDKVVKYDYNFENFEATNPNILFSLPGGGRHFSRTIRINGDRLYTSVGSSCDVCVESDPFRSTILESDLDGNNLKVFARGLRNTVFFTFDENGSMWGNDMGRDFLGDNLPPDELNIIVNSGDYGWPWCYGDSVRDRQFKPDVNPDYCSSSKVPAFKYPAHIAPLGLTFVDSPLFPADTQGDLLSVFHGSWNSSSKVGYKIVKVNIENGNARNMEDFISGWLTSKGEIIGRPVDVIFNKQGLLYISDDQANLIYLLTK